MRTLCYVILVATAMASIVAVGTNVAAYSRYNGSPACDDCHPGFRGGPGAALHDAHLSVITDCLLCHGSTGDNPQTSRCAGCHVQPGLVAHHNNAGAPPDGNGLVCVNCHPGLAPSPENFRPPYYALAACLIKDACSGLAAPGEDFTGDGQGLDNDGDLLYDGADTDCATPTEETTWGRIKALYE